MSARFWRVASFVLVACAPAVVPAPPMAGPGPSATATAASPAPAPSGRGGLCEGTTAQRQDMCGACTGDGDCEVTNFSGCCSNCEAPPRVMTKEQLRASNAPCAIIDCTPRNVRCEPVEPASAYHAVCREGACDAVRSPSAR